MEKWKSCPFCGGIPEIMNVGKVTCRLIVVKCTRCGASTKTFKDSRQDYAIEAWNRRVNDA
jgi:Lar family restriction alleviation protein